MYRFPSSEIPSLTFRNVLIDQRERSRCTLSGGKPNNNMFMFCFRFQSVRKYEERAWVSTRRGYYGYVLGV